MKRWLLVLATLGLLSTGPAALAFGKRGAYCPPPCGPACSYTYVTEYRTVTQKVCSYEPVTTEVEVTEYYCVPQTHSETRTEVYCEWLKKVEPRTRTVYKCDYETRKQKVCFVRPVTKNVECTYTVCVPKYHTEKRTCNYVVTVPRTEERTYPCTVYDSVPVKKTGQVCSYVPVTTSIPVTSCCGTCCNVVKTCYVPTYKTVEYTVMTCVPRTVEKKVQVTVCDYVTKTREYEVTVCTYESQLRKKVVPVTTCETIWEDRDVQVPVLKPYEEKYEVVICQPVQKSRTYKVDVTTYQTKSKVVKKPCTTYKQVWKTVETKVPVTVCVPVSSPPGVCVPCCW